MAQDPSLSIIGAAVSPVVMISANAILTSGINARNSNIADRLRNLTGEYRRPETNAERRQSIEKTNSAVPESCVDDAGCSPANTNGPAGSSVQ